MPDVLVGQDWFLSVLLEPGDSTSTPGCVLGGEKKGAGGVGIIKAEPQFSFRELCAGKQVEAECGEEVSLGEEVCRCGGRGEDRPSALSASAEPEPSSPFLSCLRLRLPRLPLGLSAVWPQVEPGCDLSGSQRAHPKHKLQRGRGF